VIGVVVTVAMNALLNVKLLLLQLLQFQLHSKLLSQPLERPFKLTVIGVMVLDVMNVPLNAKLRLGSHKLAGMHGVKLTSKLKL